jgi:hypothetical protein
MPNRIIRDSAKLSPTLAGLSGDEERLFWRLITVADDYGRFLAQPQAVKSLCFPMMADRIRTEKVEAWFKALVVCQLVTTYVVNGQHYGFFTNWEKHQRVRAKESKFPAPSSDNICQRLLSNVAVSESGNEDGVVIGIDSRKSALSSGTKALKVKRTESTLPPDWRLTDHHKAIADGLNLNVYSESVKFKDHHQARGTKFVDWDAAFRTWLNKAVEFKEAKR